MSEFRRRMMMVGSGGGEPLPVANGLIAWLDGKDIRTGDTRWYASNKVTSLYSGFNVAYSDNTTLVDGLSMAFGSNCGASMLLASKAYTCDNPFYHVGMSGTSDMSIEIVFNITTIGQIFGATYNTGASNGVWRYMAYFPDGDRLVIRANNGSAWSIYITSTTTTLADGNPHVLVYQKEGTTLRFYVDGILDAEVNNSALRLQVNKTGNLIGVGRYDGLNTNTGTPQGSIYSYAIYNRALSASEILQNKQSYFNRYNLS